jgi:hypothetical protein
VAEPSAARPFGAAAPRVGLSLTGLVSKVGVIWLILIPAPLATRPRFSTRHKV